MKKLILIMMAIALTLTTLTAQDKDKEASKDEIKTLAGGGNGFKSTFYLGPQVKFSKVNDESAIFAGLRGAWTINKTFSIGIAGSGLVSSHDVNYTLNDTSLVKSTFNFAYGGLYLEYIFMPREYIHVSTNVLFGFGGSNLMDRNDSLFWHRDFDKMDEPWKHYLVIEPTVAVEFNVTKFFRIVAEGSYRYTSDIYTSDEYKNVKISGNKAIKLNGLSAGLTLEFGIF